MQNVDYDYHFTTTERAYDNFGRRGKGSVLGPYHNTCRLLIRLRVSRTSFGLKRLSNFTQSW